MPIEPSPDIRRVMLEAHAAHLVGDLEAAERRLSRSDAAILVGSDPEQVFRGREEIAEALRADHGAFAAAGRRYVHGTTEAWQDGDVGWALSLGTIRYEDGREVPLRTATVLHRADGEWRILQTVASVPVPDELLEPGSPFLDALAKTEP
jgi:ketosteroid isomerase-like protein